MQRLRLTILGIGLILGMATAHGDVVAVVSDRSTVDSLSKNQVVDIFLGRVARFPNGNQAVPIDQAEGTAARNEFYTRFAGKTAAQIKAHWSKIIFTGRGQPPRAVSNSAEIKKLLASNLNGIGYIEQSAVDDSVKVVRIE
ncbi:MAG: phosphate ABC transporter substrate-binding protein [Pseudomonadota bacterium]